MVIRRAKPWFAVEYHDEKKHGFDKETPDDEWLRSVSQKKWVVISHDQRFHNDSLALEAVRQHQARVFYLSGGSLKTWDKLRIFTESFRRMHDIIKTEKPPYIYRISYECRITRVKGI
jgi:hypothetical protein